MNIIKHLPPLNNINIIKPLPMPAAPPAPPAYPRYRNRNDEWHETALKVLSIVGMGLLIGALSPLVGLMAALKFSNNRIRSVVSLCTGKKDVALVIQASEDPGRAFQNKVNFWLRDSYPITHKFVSHIDHVAAAIDQMPENHKIKVLWIRAHGSSKRIKLGKPTFIQKNMVMDDKFIHEGNIEKLKRSFEKLDPDAVIIIGACSTGKKTTGNLCIAEKIAALAPGRTVYAPKDAMAYSIVTGAHPVKVAMLKPRTLGTLGRWQRNLQEICLTYLGIPFIDNLANKFRVENV